MHLANAAGFCSIINSTDSVGVGEMQIQQQPQCTCLANMVVGSSLTPCTALLVPPSCTVYIPIVDHYEFIGSKTTVI